jgi:hypothetical protein
MYDPIPMKFGTQTNFNKLSSKNTSPTVRRHYPRWPPPPPPCCITLEGCISAIYDPILMKFGTQTKNNPLNPKNRITDCPTPLSKMAAAAAAALKKL